ncbi:hypothetical protein RM863_33580, partial [Streptomyces sp. DSM 41014]
GLPFGLAFPTLSDLSDPISSVLSGVFAFALSLSGGSDFIRSSESDFPALPGTCSGCLKLPGSRLAEP